jgi:hypothetical protein
MKEISQELDNQFANSKDMPVEQKLSPKARKLTANPGDRIADHPQTIVEYPDGEKKAFHHVKDAEKISDVIRQARMDEHGNRIWW